MLVYAFSVLFLKQTVPKHISESRSKTVKNALTMAHDPGDPNRQNNGNALTSIFLSDETCSQCNVVNGHG